MLYGWRPTARDWPSITGPRLAAMHGRLSAPLLREAADGQIYVLIEPKHVHNDTPIKQVTVWVCVREVSRQKLLVSKLFKDALRGGELVITEDA